MNDQYYTILQIVFKIPVIGEMIERGREGLFLHEDVTLFLDYSVLHLRLLPGPGIYFLRER